MPLSKKQQVKLLNLIDPAITTLAREMVSASKSSDRQRAANSILDRAGVARVQATPDSEASRELLVERLRQLRQAQQAPRSEETQPQDSEVERVDLPDTYDDDQPDEAPTIRPIPEGAVGIDSDGDYVDRFGVKLRYRQAHDDDLEVEELIDRARAFTLDDAKYISDDERDIRTRTPADNSEIVERVKKMRESRGVPYDGTLAEAVAAEATDPLKQSQPDRDGDVHATDPDTPTDPDTSTDQ